MRKGPLYMVFAALFFTAMIACVKVARRELSAMDVIVWRTIVAVPLAWLLSRRIAHVRIHNAPVMLMRIGIGFAAMLCFYTAARGISVADLSLIAKLQPVAVGIMAPLLLGRRERVGWTVGIALAGGVLGSAILIGPDLAVGSTYGLYAMAAAVLSAGAHLCIRVLGRTEHPDAIVLWFQTGLFFLATATLFLVEGRLPRLPSGDLLLPVLAVGVLATGGQFLMTRAYRHDRATLVAGASYAGPLWAVLIDIAAFSSWPTSSVLLGGALIVGSGLVFLRRDR